MKRMLSILVALTMALLLAVPGFAAETAEVTAAEATTEATEATEAAETTEAEQTAAVEATTDEAEAEAPAAQADAKQSEGYKLYEAAMKKIEKLSSVGWQGNMKTSMVMGDETIEMGQRFVVRQVIKEDGSIDMEMVMITDGVEDTVYFTNDALYMIIDGKKVKTDMGISELIATLDEDGTLAAMDEEAMTLTKVDEREDGSVAVWFAMKKELLQDVINEVYQEMELDANISKLSRIAYKFVVDAEGNFSSMSMYLDASFEIEGETVTMSNVTNMKLISTNQYAKIYFPDDLNLYVKTAI